MQVIEVMSLATSLSSEKQNKFAQLLYKTHMSYLDSEATSSIFQHFLKCFQKVSKTYTMYITKHVRTCTMYIHIIHSMF